MSDHYDKVHNHVKSYYDEQLFLGRSVLDIMNRFKDSPLPQDLTTGKIADDKVLCRHGQIVGTNLLIKQKDIESATLPNSDIINRGY